MERRELIGLFLIGKMCTESVHDSLFTASSTQRKYAYSNILKKFHHQKMEIFR